MSGLVLAIEPDLHQAEILTRIVREKVRAEITVVDSREAALAAIAARVPDVLLLSALLSPREEDELIARLRSLEQAAHLQTHTIPQLAVGPADQDDTPKRGLLSAFRKNKKKAPDGQTAGCAPAVFAEQVRIYLQSAAEKKREVAATGGVSPTINLAGPQAIAPRDEVPADQGTGSSSWASPFEWRPANPTSLISQPVSRLLEPEEAAAIAVGAHSLERVEPEENVPATTMQLLAPAEPEHHEPETPSVDEPVAETVAESMTSAAAVFQAEPEPAPDPMSAFGTDSSSGDDVPPAVELSLEAESMPAAAEAAPLAVAEPVSVVEPVSLGTQHLAVAGEPELPVLDTKPEPTHEIDMSAHDPIFEVVQEPERDLFAKTPAPPAAVEVDFDALAAAAAPTAEVPRAEPSAFADFEDFLRHAPPLDEERFVEEVAAEMSEPVPARRKAGPRMRDARWLRSEPILTAVQKKAPGDDLRGLLAGLAIPGAIASVRYPSGCRIRRVRVVPHDEAAIESSGPVIVSRRALDDARRVNR